MTAFRIQQLLLAVVICLNITTYATATTKTYNPACVPCKTGADDDEENFIKEECATCMTTLFNTAKTFITQSKMQCFNVTNPLPCDNIELDGVHLVEMYKDATSHAVDCGTGKCVDHTLYLRIPKLAAKIYCLLDTDPTKVMKLLQETMSKENFGMECNAPKEVLAQLPKPNIPECLNDPTKMAQLKSCIPMPIPTLPPGMPAPPAVKVPSFGKRSASPPPTIQEGKVIASWEDIKLVITLRACKGQNYIVLSGAYIDNPNLDTLLMKCDGTKEFNTSCECLLETEFLKTLMLQAVQFVFPCYCDKVTEGYEEEVNKLHCKTYYGQD